MSERNAYNAFRNGILRKNDRLDRIENLSCVGMPDVNGCFEGAEFWLEIKQAKEPKRKRTPLLWSQHGFSIDQSNWMLAQCNAGGKGFAYIETDKRRMLIWGTFCDILNESPMEQLILLSLWTGPRKMSKENWDELRQVIIGWK